MLWLSCWCLQDKPYGCRCVDKHFPEGNGSFPSRLSILGREEGLWKWALYLSQRLSFSSFWVGSQHCPNSKSKGSLDIWREMEAEVDTSPTGNPKTSPDVLYYAFFFIRFQLSIMSCCILSLSQVLWNKEENLSHSGWRDKKEGSSPFYLIPDEARMRLAALVTSPVQLDISWKSCAVVMQGRENKRGPACLGCAWGGLWGPLQTGEPAEEQLEGELSLAMKPGGIWATNFSH